jgi:DNA repair exonuclease SbcCD ATPase subunit
VPERLAQRLQGVAAALAGMQQRQQAALEPLAALATQVQQRTQRLGEHMQSFGALGQAASEVNALLGASQEDRSGLAQAEARLQEISEAARTLFEAARADDFPDVAREADVLKQRMAALGKRLGRPIS